MKSFVCILQAFVPANYLHCSCWKPLPEIQVRVTGLRSLFVRLEAYGLAADMNAMPLVTRFAVGMLKIACRVTDGYVLSATVMVIIASVNTLSSLSRCVILSRAPCECIGLTTAMKYQWKIAKERRQMLHKILLYVCTVADGFFSLVPPH